MQKRNVVQHMILGKLDSHELKKINGHFTEFIFKMSEFKYMMNEKLRRVMTQDY